MSISCDWDRLIDPDFAGENRWFGGASYEALRVALVSNIEYVLALPQSVFRLPIVNRGWRQQADGVTVFLIVPVKKPLTESAAVLDAAKAVREYFMVRNVGHLKERHSALSRKFVACETHSKLRHYKALQAESKSTNFWDGITAAFCYKI